MFYPYGPGRCNIFFPYLSGAMYSLCQKKRMFNSEFICAPPPWGGGPKSHMVDVYIIDYVNVWPPPQGGHKKFGIKWAFLLTQTVVLIWSHLSMCTMQSPKLCFSTKKHV